MDENTTMTTEGMEQTSDAFLEGWGDEAETGTVADQHETEEAETEQTAEQSEPAEEAERSAEGDGETTRAPAAEQEGASQAQQAEQADVPKTWTLRHLDDQRVVGEQEMVALAQKGLDYDRIREKYDEAKPVMELFGRFARQNNMTIQDYTAHLRTQAMKASGMSEAEAKRAVELEDREAAVAAKEAAEAEKQAASQRKADADARRNADIKEFQMAFPEAAKDPKSIPQEVWADVRKGMSLVTAYSKYQVAQANAKAEEAQRTAAAAQQNRKNAERSAGSMKSAGADSKSKDPFLEGFGA